MSEGNSVPVNGQRLRELRNNQGLTQKQIADACNVSEQTVRRWERGEAAYLSYLASVASFLGVGVAELSISQANLELLATRDISGTWQIDGNDISVPGHLEYQDAKSFRATIEIQQAVGIVQGNGKTEDEVPITISGNLVEGGNHFFGQYVIHDPRSNIYGSLVAQFLPDGSSMDGFYLGREVGQGTTYVFGKLTGKLL